MNKKTPIENISLAFACDKDWNAMRTCYSGRHCSACDKTVIDFTNKHMNELYQVLEEEGQVCGRFLPSQLSETIKPKLFNFKRVAASLLLALGFGTFSRDIQAQAITCTNSKHNHDKTQSGQAFGMIQETAPSYKHGGEQAMLEFIKKNLQQPSNETVNGLVLTSFVIDTTGKVTEPKIVKGISEAADKEALRVVKLLEFYPSTRHSKKVPVRYTLPIKFNSETRRKKQQ